MAGENRIQMTAERAETLNKDFKLFITGREGREGDILSGKKKLLPELREG